MGFLKGTAAALTLLSVAAAASACGLIYEQCGGIGFDGVTCCSEGLMCMRMGPVRVRVGRDGWAGHRCVDGPCNCHATHPLLLSGRRTSFPLRISRPTDLEAFVCLLASPLLMLLSLFRPNSITASAVPCPACLAR